MPKSYVTNIMDINKLCIEKMARNEPPHPPTTLLKYLKSIYQHLNHHVCRNQYSTWELNEMIALYSRNEQNTTNVPHKYKVLHTICTPNAYL